MKNSFRFSPVAEKINAKNVKAYNTTFREDFLTEIADMENLWELTVIIDETPNPILPSKTNYEFLKNITILANGQPNIDANFQSFFAVILKGDFKTPN